jgi:putative phosphoesterase
MISHKKFRGLKHQDAVRIGVLSDTHGLLRSNVFESLCGADLIVHAGDIGTPEVLKELNKISPVVAVRGNMDNGHWARKLPQTELVRIKDALIYVIHDLYTLDFEPAAFEIRVVIHGHSHRPAIQHRNGLVYLNPGSAGHRRFDYPISVAILQVRENDLEPQIIELDPA